jgi:hypothetical protein
MAANTLVSIGVVVKINAVVVESAVCNPTKKKRPLVYKNSNNL